MVKIKVHSRNDIIKAYLRGLGYDVDIDISKLLASYESLNQQDDISKSFDDIIYNKAKKVFSKDLSKMQLVALYKALFIEVRYCLILLRLMSISKILHSLLFLIIKYRLFQLKK